MYGTKLDEISLCDHEEADIKIIQYAADTAQKKKKKKERRQVKKKKQKKKKTPSNTKKKKKKKKRLKNCLIRTSDSDILCHT